MADLDGQLAPRFQLLEPGEEAIHPREVVCRDHPDDPDQVVERGAKEPLVHGVLKRGTDACKCFVTRCGEWGRAKRDEAQMCSLRALNPN